MSAERERKITYHFMVVLAIIVGVVGIGLLFLPDFEILTFMLTLAVLGGLIGGSSGYTEKERRILERSYKIAFEWLLLVIMAAFAFIELVKWLPILGGAVEFLKDHWPGLVVASMCVLMGIAGLIATPGKDI